MISVLEHTSVLIIMWLTNVFNLYVFNLYRCKVFINLFVVRIIRMWSQSSNTFNFIEFQRLMFLKLNWHKNLWKIYRCFLSIILKNRRQQFIKILNLKLRLILPNFIYFKIKIRNLKLQCLNPRLINSWIENNYNKLLFLRIICLKQKVTKVIYKWYRNIIIIEWVKGYC